MRYSDIHAARFLDRPNRFIAHLELPDGEIITAHVKNTGRCRELLLPGATVYAQHHDNSARKTAWSLIAVEKNAEGQKRLINMDSQAPNRAVEEALRSGLILPGMDSPAVMVRREAAYGDSRLDFYLETAGRKAFIEVKGVTLEECGAVLFPDAPTARGAKHLRELARACGEGCLAYALFVVQMADVRWFGPNTSTDPAFAAALREAWESGVRVLAYDCAVAPDAMTLRRPVEVRL